MSQGFLIGETFLCKDTRKLLTRDEAALVDYAAQAQCSEASEICPRPIQQLGHRECSLRGKMVEAQSSCLVTVEYLKQLPGVTGVSQLLESFQELAPANAHVMMYIEAAPKPHEAAKFQSTPGMELWDSAQDGVLCEVRASGNEHLTSFCLCASSGRIVANRFLPAHHVACTRVSWPANLAAHR